MYVDFFQLRDDPFKAGAGGFRFAGGGFGPARAELVRRLRSGGRLCLLSSPPGLGKSTLLRAVAADLRAAGLTAELVLCNRWRTAPELLGAAPGHGVLLLDEAQDLPPAELAALLAGADAAGIGLLVAGQPQVEALVQAALPAGRAADEVMIRRLRPLTSAETAAYVTQRLTQAGGADGALFPAPALAAIATITGGVPRLINRLCAATLFLAAIEGAARIGPSHLAEAAEGLALSLPPPAAPGRALVPVAVQLPALPPLRPARPRRRGFDPVLAAGAAASLAAAVCIGALFVHLDRQRLAESLATASSPDPVAERTAAGFVPIPAPAAPALPAPAAPASPAPSAVVLAEAPRPPAPGAVLTLPALPPLPEPPAPPAAKTAGALAVAATGGPGRPGAVRAVVPGPATGPEVARGTAVAVAATAVAAGMRLELPAVAAPPVAQAKPAGGAAGAATVALAPAAPTLADAASADDMEALEISPVALTQAAFPAGSLLEEPAAPAGPVPAGVDVLLARAEAQLGELKLTTPPGDNAVESFRRVLALVPRHAAAQAGIERTGLRYVDLARAAMRRGDPARAARYADKAEELAPEHPRVLDLLEEHRVRVAVEERKRIAAVRRGGAPLAADALADLGRLTAALQAGAVTEVRFDDGHTPLTLAAQQGRTDALRRLLQAGADPAFAAAAGGTALMYAAWRGDLAAVDALLLAGASPDMQNIDGKTALMAAAINGHEDVAALLLRAGADPDRQSFNGWTALMYAAWGRHAEVVDRILLAGGDPLIPNEHGLTAAALAAERDAAAIARRLSPAAAKVDTAAPPTRQAATN